MLTHGRRKLAYEVGRSSVRVLCIIHYTAEPSVTAELERNFKISDDVIRYLIVKEEE